MLIMSQPRLVRVQTLLAAPCSLELPSSSFQQTYDSPNFYGFQNYLAGVAGSARGADFSSLCPTLRTQRLDSLFSEFAKELWISVLGTHAWWQSSVFSNFDGLFGFARTLGPRWDWYQLDFVCKRSAQAIFAAVSCDRVCDSRRRHTPYGRITP
jgi:hypothetical protein